MELNLGNHSTTWQDVWDREQGIKYGTAPATPKHFGRESSMEYRMGGGSGMGGWGGKRMRLDDMGGGDMSLRDENQMLKFENEQLRMRVQELTATNKFLLEQNAEARMKQMNNLYR